MSSQYGVDIILRLGLKAVHCSAMRGLKRREQSDGVFPWLRFLALRVYPWAG
jgi:hypothetical protein